MKRLSTLLIAILSLSMFQTVMAEEGWHFGPTVGYENTSVDLKLGSDKITYTNLSGFNIGGLAEYRPLNWLGIESGLQFVMNGYWAKGWTNYTFSGKTYQVSEEYKNNLYYFMFPLYIEGLIPISDEFSINIECGPEFYAGLDSKTTYTLRLASSVPGQQDQAKSWYAGIFDTTLSRFNCTIHLAGGIQYAGFRLMAGYNFGVYNMYVNGGHPMIDPEYILDTTTDSFKMSGFVINISYLF